MEKMIEDARAILKKEAAKSYSISTIIPSDWMIKEEAEFDRSLGNESIKNRVNRIIPEQLGGNYVREGEIRLIFDFKSNTVNFERLPIFVFGRYLKSRKGLSQSRWIDRDGKKLYDSVEEKIGEPLKRIFDADDYVLHASGREDVDATNSAGRAFVMEITNPKNRDADIGEIEQSVGDGVAIRNVRIVERRFVEFVTESHFDKKYRARIEFGREINEKDRELMESLVGKTLSQKTPLRVSHRRADLVRMRKIKELEVEEMEGNSATISVKAEPGTYIKEMISGDSGRTTPSISGLLGTSARCTDLEVTEIDDSFMDFILHIS